MDKEYVRQTCIYTHRHNGFSFSLKKERNWPFATVYMDLECIMLSEIRKKNQILQGITYVWVDNAKLVETKSRTVFIRGWGQGTWRNIGQRVKVSSDKINEVLMI